MQICILHSLSLDRCSESKTLRGVDSCESIPYLAPLAQISDIQDSLDLDPQEHSLTRTIDEEAELEERDEREREEGHPEQDDEDEDREHEVMTAGSKSKCLISSPTPGFLPTSRGAVSCSHRKHLVI